MINTTVMRLTTASILGRRRALALLALPLVLVGLALLVRALAGTDQNVAQDLLGVFALGTLMPLVGLIAGTGAVGPEIDDGSIVYVLAKPIRRSTIIFSKLAVAASTAVAVGALPVLLAGIVLTGEATGVAVGYAIGAVAASIAYAALFLALAVVTRSAVVVGLLYALVWESAVGQIVPGAQTLSVQQWSLAVAERAMGDIARVLGVSAAVDFRTGVILLVLTTVLATWYATRQLARLHLSEQE